jgi:Zn-dependent M28 family amino/carboxypeptidase
MYKVISAPKLRQTAPGIFNYTEQTDFLSSRLFSGAADFQSAVSVVPSYGCSEGDFANFVNGTIALISEGGNCTFLVKVQLAEAADAKGVLVYDEASASTANRKDLFSEAISASVSIPAFTLSAALGEAFKEIPGLMLHMSITASQYNVTTSNIIADTTKGNPNLTIVVGSHLDSVPAGPGINDNGSGSSTNLELALLFFKLGIIPSNRMRFAWWGAEEIGLLGSKYYVAHLSPEQKEQIALNINLDMIASPNFFRGVYNASSGASDIRNASLTIQGLFEEYFNENQLPFDLTPMAGSSDHYSFITNGIPAGGLFTGAGVTKSPAMRSKYKGLANAAFDPCYHQQCDTVDNINEQALTEMSKAAAYVIDFLAPMPDLEAFLDGEP